MFTYVFHGKVIPERTDLTLSGLPPFTITQPDSNLTFTLSLVIVKSIISAFVTTEAEISDLLSLRNFVKDAISFYVDSIGYEQGCGYNIEVESCTYNNGSLMVFGVNIPKLKDDKKWVSVNEIIQAHQHATPIQQQQLQRALGELKRGIDIAYDTGFHAYRAIEALKKSFNDSWDEMNTALNINRTYTDQLRIDHANPQRHGAFTYMNSNERTDMLSKAKTIIGRYVTFILNDNQKLSEATYPILT